MPQVYKPKPLSPDAKLEPNPEAQAAVDKAKVEIAEAQAAVSAARAAVRPTTPAAHARPAVHPTRK